MSTEVSESCEGSIEIQRDEGTCKTELVPPLNACKENANLQDLIPCFLILDRVLK